MEEIITSETLENGYYGRNGRGKVIGYLLSADNYDSKLSISPINSRKKVGNCRISIPFQDLDLFISKLQRMKLEIVRAKILKPATRSS